MQTEHSLHRDGTEPRYDQTNHRYYLHYDVDGPATLTTTIVHALSTVTNVDVSQGEFSLYDSIDPDALERIFAPKVDGSPRSEGHVSFVALDHQIFVHANGDIYIYPPDE